MLYRIMLNSENSILSVLAMVCYLLALAVSYQINDIFKSIVLIKNAVWSSFAKTVAL